VIPAAGAGSDQPGSRREANGEQFVRTRYWRWLIALGAGTNGFSEGVHLIAFSLARTCDIACVPTSTVAPAYALVDSRVMR
jgi:hypothetical protein